VDTRKFVYRKQQSLMSQIFDSQTPFEDVEWSFGRPMSRFNKDLEHARSAKEQYLGSL
jgi:hypothetical protein